MIMMARRWRWQIPMYIYRPAKQWIARQVLAFLRWLGDTELDTIEETLRLATMERDGLHEAIKAIHIEVNGDAPFYSYQRVHHDIRRMKAAKWN
jgi:hypothetical protein